MSSAVSLFFQAVYSDQPRKLISILKRTKIDPNIVDQSSESKCTAINYACEHQLLEIAEVLLKTKPKPADVNCEDKNGKRPLWWAVQNGNSRLTSLLVNSKKCEIDYFDRETGYTPLCKAVLTGQTKICKILIDSGSDPNLNGFGNSSDAESPLIKAVQLNSLDITKVLVNSLCNINCRTSQGYTALHYAIAYRRYEITEFLLENKINIHSSSHTGVTPMTVAIENNNPAMVRTLIKYGYNMNKAYKWGETALEQAINTHDEKCALTLVIWGCQLRLAKKSYSFFWMAASAGLNLLVELLIKIKPSYLNETWIKEGRWPLALYSKPEIQLLLQTLSSQPVLLKELCRASIFRHVKHFPSRFKQLPLPHELLEYISFADLVPESFYIQSDLAIQCPRECDVMHSKRDKWCAVVEVSDIESDGTGSDIEGK